MNMTKHATIRQQQRGIPQIVVDLLIEYGTQAHARRHTISTKRRVSAFNAMSVAYPACLKSI